MNEPTIRTIENRVHTVCFKAFFDLADNPILFSQKGIGYASPIRPKKIVHIIGPVFR